MVSGINSCQTKDDRRPTWPQEKKYIVSTNINNPMLLKFQNVYDIAN